MHALDRNINKYRRTLKKIECESSFDRVVYDPLKKNKKREREKRKSEKKLDLHHLMQ